MELLGDFFEDEQKFEDFIRHVPSTIQRKATKNSKMSGRETEMSENEHRRSDDPSCHNMGCSCPLLHDQHWQTSEVFDFSQSADELAVPTFRPVGEVDIDFRANTQGCQDNEEPTNQGATPADNNNGGVEIKTSEDHKELVRGVANRKQESQKTINKFTTGSRFRDPSSLSSGREWEFERENGSLAIRQLCGNEHMLPSSIMETRITNQNSCNKDGNTRNDITLRELPPNNETQHTQDVASLLKLLKNKYPYHEATNNDILTDYEIRIFEAIYGITDYRLMLACGNYCFWLEGPDRVIYLWSRIDDSMIRGGDNMKEALTNYLFHRENLRYVDEYTLELIPLDAYDKEAEEWAKSPEAYVDIDVTKVSLKHESKMGGKKKQQKKKKNKKKH